MNRNSVSKLFLPPLILAVISWVVQDASAADKKEATPAAADVGATKALEKHLCSIEVSYTWKRLPKKREPGTPAESSEPTKIFHRRLTEEAPVLEDSKNKVASRVSGLKAEAEQNCKREHEDRAGCIKARLKDSREQYALLDYAARKAILDAIGEDCELQTGRCISSEAGEVTCETVAIAPPPAAEEAAGEKPAAGKKK